MEGFFNDIAMNDNRPWKFTLDNMRWSSADRLPRIGLGWSRRSRGGGMSPVEWCGFLPGTIWLESGKLDIRLMKDWLQMDDGWL